MNPTRLDQTIDKSLGSKSQHRLQQTIKRIPDVGASCYYKNKLQNYLSGLLRLLGGLGGKAGVQEVGQVGQGGWDVGGGHRGRDIEVVQPQQLLASRPAGVSLVQIQPSAVLNYPPW